MRYFSQKFFTFFDELSKQNSKEFFERNRATYEKEVKQPFRKLVEDLTEKLAKDIPELNRDAGKAIFRINRDIRFSKDKSPYKVHVAAVFSRTGTKDQEYPGFYIHLGADDVMIGGGKYFCAKEDIAKIRQEIFYNNTSFKKLLNDKAFKEKYGELQGDKSKILTPEYKEFATEQPLIANKQFWYYSKILRKDVTGDRLESLIYSYFKAGYKMNKFLQDTLKD